MNYRATFDVVVLVVFVAVVVLAIVGMVGGDPYAIGLLVVGLVGLCATVIMMVKHRRSRSAGKH